MLAKSVVLIGEAEDRFIALADSIVNEFQPCTESEMAAVDLMIVARWRHLRTLAIQKSEFDLEMAQQEGPAAIRAAHAFRSLTETGRTLDLANRYEISYERQYNRALKNFQQLKAHRPKQLPAYQPDGLAAGTFKEPSESPDEPAEGPEEKNTFLRNEPSPKNEQDQTGGR